MNTIYVVNKPLIFTDTLDLELYTYISIQENTHHQLVDLVAFYRNGTLVATNTVHKQTVEVWTKYDYILPVPETPIPVYGNVFNTRYHAGKLFENRYYIVNEDADPELIRIKEQYQHDNNHGCYGAIVLYPESIYVTPVMDRLDVLTKTIYDTLHKNNKYWIFKAPEPTIKRLKNLFSNDLVLVYPQNIEKLISRLSDFEFIKI